MRRWYVVGAYVPPNDNPDVHRMEQVPKAVPEGVEVIMLGELNFRMRDPHDEREEYLATTLADCGLVDITYHFLPRRRYRGDRYWTCRIQREGRKVKGGGVCPIHG